MTPSVVYDAKADAAYIRFSDGIVKESEEVSPGVVLDYDANGHIVGMEVLAAKKHLAKELLTKAA